MFDEVKNLTGGGPGNATITISQYIYNLSFVYNPQFGYAAAVLSVYILEDLFTLKIYIYTAYIITAALAFPPPKIIILAAAAIFLFLLFAQYPSFIGSASIGNGYINPGSTEIISAIVFMSNSIGTVYQLKTIFEEVTGINVKIEWGNMRHEYGPMINKVIARIIQEAFTNAIRHGKASFIFIQFWEFPMIKI